MTRPGRGLPLFSSLAGYDRAWLRGDLLAGMTVWAVLVPEALAYASIAGVGFLASFISEPVLKGFIIGLALTIISGQLPDLLGVEGAGGDFFERVWGVLADLGQTSMTTLAVGLASLALVFGLRRFAPKVPGSLVAVLAGIAAVWLLDLDHHGVGIVGQIGSGMPALGPPDVPVDHYLALAPAAAGVMLVGFAEGLGAAKIYAARPTTRSTPTGSCSAWSWPP